jgi:fibronectin type III domain protein
MRIASRPLAFAFDVALAALLSACGSDSTAPPQVSAPTAVTATSTSTTSIRLTWNQVTGADSYEIDRASGSGAMTNIKAGLTTTFYEDVGLNPSTQYSYVIRAVHGATKSSNSAQASATTGTPGPKVAVINGVTSSRTLYSDTVYTLSGYVKVSNGATLTIQAGTKIIGDTLVTGSSLWILRGAKIDAQGTATNPIVFTSARSAGNRKPGDWGGIIIVGNALINRTANPVFTEGPTGAAENYAGGNNASDSSGVLKYVRVEFAGYDVSNGGGQELNSISSYAVGRKTTYDYVQSMAGLDDAFEFFGGSVDIRHMVSFESGDDHYDWTEGYNGRGQFLIALQTSVIQPRPGTGTVSSDPRGFEGDGCEIDKAGCTFTNTPFSVPVWANFTIIGPGTGVFTPTDGNGAVIRRGSGGSFVNGIIGRWPGVGISIRDQASRDLLTVDSLYFRNVILADNGSNFEPAGTNFGSVIADNATAWSVTTSTAAALFSGALPTGSTAVTTANLNLTLANNSPAASGGLSTFTPLLTARTTNFFGAAMPATAYQGAVDPGTGAKWYEGWTNWVRN